MVSEAMWRRVILEFDWTKIECRKLCESRISSVRRKLQSVMVLQYMEAVNKTSGKSSSYRHNKEFTTGITGFYSGYFENLSTKEGSILSKCICQKLAIHHAISEFGKIKILFE